MDPSKLWSDYARKVYEGNGRRDAQGLLILCHSIHGSKVMFATEADAQRTALEIMNINGAVLYSYECPEGPHRHLTTQKWDKERYGRNLGQGRH